LRQFSIATLLGRAQRAGVASADAVDRTIVANRAEVAFAGEHGIVEGWVDWVLWDAERNVHLAVDLHSFFEESDPP
jgi:hypothetical protein